MVVGIGLSVVVGISSHVLLTFTSNPVLHIQTFSMQCELFVHTTGYIVLGLAVVLLSSDSVVVVVVGVVVVALSLEQSSSIAKCMKN